MLDVLPIEVLERIIYFCDYNSFFSLSQTSKLLQQIYLNYDLDSYPLFVGIVYLEMILISNSRLPNINEEAEEAIYPISSHFRNKLFITRDNKELTKFLVKYIELEDNILEEIHDNGGIIKFRIKKARCYYKKVSLHEKIAITNYNLHEFHVYRFYMNTRTDLVRDYLFYDNIGLGMPLYRQSLMKTNFKVEQKRMLDNIHQEGNKHINYIRTYIGNNKLNLRIYIVVLKVYEPLLFYLGNLFFQKLILTTDEGYVRRNKKTIDIDMNQLRQRLLEDHHFDEIRIRKIVQQKLISFGKEYDMKKI